MSSDKRFDLDVGKRRARARFREFIKKRLFDRKHKRVLCFPGKYGLEIEQVYRKLGIPDENIYGVERDIEAAKHIHLNYPKINLFRGDISDFISQYTGPAFDIISLDYCGYFTADKLKPLGLLYVNGYIADKAVVAINIMAGREKEEKQSFLREAYLNSLVESLDILTADKMNEAIQAAKNDDLADVRDDALTHSLINLISYQLPAAVVCSTQNLTTIHGYGVRLGINTEVAFTNKGLSFKNAEVESAKDIHHARIPSIVKHEAIQDINRQLINTGIVQQNSSDILRYHLGRTLVMHFFDKYGLSYLPTGLERYSYISDSGRRMVSDYIEFRTFREELNRIPDGIVPCHNQDTEEHKFFLYGTEKFNKPAEYLNYLMTKIAKPYAILSEKVKSLPQQWPNRIDLGGGETIGFNEEKAKQHVINLIKRGKSCEEIANKYPMFGIGKIRAIKAHCTMKTYE